MSTLVVEVPHELVPGTGGSIGECLLFFASSSLLVETVSAPCSCCTNAIVMVG